MIDQTTLFAGLASIFALTGLVSFVFGQYLFAGFCFLLVTMAIYLRETRT